MSIHNLSETTISDEIVPRVRHIRDLVSLHMTCKSFERLLHHKVSILRKGSEMMKDLLHRTKAISKDLDYFSRYSCDYRSHCIKRFYKRDAIPIPPTSIYIKKYYVTFASDGFIYACLRWCVCICDDNAIPIYTPRENECLSCDGVWTIANRIGR